MPKPNRLLDAVLHVEAPAEAGHDALVVAGPADRRRGAVRARDRLGRGVQGARGGRARRRRDPNALAAGAPGARRCDQCGRNQDDRDAEPSRDSVRSAHVPKFRRGGTTSGTGRGRFGAAAPCRDRTRPSPRPAGERRSTRSSRRGRRGPRGGPASATSSSVQRATVTSRPSSSSMVRRARRRRRGSGASERPCDCRWPAGGRRAPASRRRRDPPAEARLDARRSE